MPIKASSMKSFAKPPVQSLKPSSKKQNKTKQEGPLKGQHKMKGVYYNTHIADVAINHCPVIMLLISILPFQKKDINLINKCKCFCF